MNRPSGQKENVMMTLEQTVDKIGFEMISKNHPQIIAEVEAMLNRGVTARQIEKRLRRNSTSLTAKLVVCAAHYMEAQRKAN